jgi:DNA-directed RNA polymerase specialized sigma24 family protein
MSSELYPEMLPVASLCRLCREQTARFRRGEEHDDRFCFEVVRRSIVQRDDDCWAELHAIYHDLVLSWCRASGGSLGLDPEELVASTWVKFWRSYTPDKLALAPGTSAVLAYLKMCAHSVTVDEARSRRALVPLDESHPLEHEEEASPGDLFAIEAARVDLWKIIDGHLRDERERVLMHLAYELRLKSAEVQRARPDLFPTVADVYRISRNILDRLKRSRELRGWIEEDGL